MQYNLPKINGRDRYFICDVCQGKFLVSQSYYISDPNSQQYGFLVCHKDKDKVWDLRHRQRHVDLTAPDPRYVRIERTSQFETLDQTSMIETGVSQILVGFVPEPPSNFFLIDATAGQTLFGFSLTLVGSASVTGYRIERESPIGGGYSVLTTNNMKQNTQVLDNTTISGYTYGYRLKAINLYGSSDYSTEFTVIVP